MGRVHLLAVVVYEDGAGSGEDVEAEVAAAFDPFVVLFGEDGADQADDRGPVGEDADHVGAARISRLSRFSGVVGHSQGDWTPNSR